MKFHNNKGFTLLEMMVVLVILGLLMSIVVPNVMTRSDEARETKAVADITSLVSALDSYKLDNYQRPSSEQGLQALTTQPTIEPIPRSYPEGGYIRELPNDPWGNAYLYLNPGEHSNFDVFSMGPDMEANTEDDIGNWNLKEHR